MNELQYEKVSAAMTLVQLWTPERMHLEYASFAVPRLGDFVIVKGYFTKDMPAPSECFESSR